MFLVVITPFVKSLDGNLFISFSLLNIYLTSSLSMLNATDLNFDVYF